MKPILTHPSYNDIEKGCAMIALQVAQSGTDPQVIVGLTRGGLLPAVILSHMLNIPMNAVSYSSHKGQGDNKNHINILPHIPGTDYESGTGQLPRAPRLLIVDDILDSGRTMEEVVAHYDKEGHEISVASLYWKDSAVFVPDFYWQQIPEDSPWIIFPFET